MESKAEPSISSSPLLTQTCLYHLGNVMVKCSARKSNPQKLECLNVLYAKKAVCGCGSINQFVISELISQDFVSDYLWLVFGVVCTLANLTKKLWTIKMVKAKKEGNPFWRRTFFSILISIFKYDRLWWPMFLAYQVLMGGFVKLFGITIISNDTYVLGRFQS